MPPGTRLCAFTPGRTRSGVYLFGGYTYQGSAVSQIYTAINTPTTHYYTGSSNPGWISSNPDSWTRANHPTSLTAKSIFDPCPYGYRVPTSNDNTKGNSDFFGFPKPPIWTVNIINGMQFVGSWWPASGGRNYISAALSDIGRYSSYWSASPYPSSNPYLAYDLTFYSGYVNPADSDDNRSFGYSVRCVQE